MQNRISNTENRRGGEPQPIGEILAELLAQYQDRFPAADISVVQTPAGKEDQIMLVLSRRVGERIVIDGNITVTVVEIQGGKIRLGIEAPKEVPVWREEIMAKELVGV